MDLVALSARYKNFIISFALVIFAVLFVAYLISTKPTQAPVKIETKYWPIEVLKINKKSLSPIYTLYGTVENPKLVQVKSPISGRIAHIAQVGETLKKGEVIFALSKLDRQLPVKKAKAILDKAKANLELQKMIGKNNRQKLRLERKILQFKKTALKRLKQIASKGLGSQALLDKAEEAVIMQKKIVLSIELLVQQQEPKIQQMQAQVQSEYASFSQAKLNAKRSYITATKTVRISQVYVAPNEQVSMNTKVISYYSSTNLEVKALIPITLYPLVQRQHLSGSPVEAYSNKHKISLRLIRLSAKSQTSGINAFFKIKKFKNNKNLPPKIKIQTESIDNSPNAITQSVVIGELITLELKLSPKPESFAVPYTALFGSNKIYTVKNNTLTSAKVQLLGDTIVNNQRWALLQGNVPDNSQVMITHLPNAINNLKVKVFNKNITSR